MPPMSTSLTLCVIATFVTLIASKQLPGGPINPLAEPCPGFHNNSIVCINRYASVLPHPFLRLHPKDGSLGPLDTFPDTNVTDDSFDLVSNATFIVFNPDRALEILGPSPELTKVFDLPPGKVRDAPVFLPESNSIVFSTFRADVIPQQIINLNDEPPSLSDLVPDPPVYGINGGRYHTDGLVYWAAAGGFPFQYPNRSSVVYQTPCITVFDPETNKSQAVVNNYYGSQFNGPDDLVVASNGDIYFTDPWYGWSENLTTNPIAPAATWRFRPSTGVAQVIESTLVQPNGIELSPDEKTLYIGDTGLTVFNQPDNMIPRFSINSTGPRFLYAFDLVDSPGGKYPTNKRVIYMAHEFGLDGIKVAANGLLIGGTGTAIDVLTPEGELLIQIRMDTIVNNVQFAGANLDELWIFGYNGVNRLRWNLRGLDIHTRS